MSSQKVTLDLTWPIIIWTVLFGVLAFLTGSAALWFVAFGPLALFIGFMAAVWLFAVIVLSITYLRGYPITVTTRRKGTRIVRRKR
jgi:hypothetical protein